MLYAIDNDKTAIMLSVLYIYIYIYDLIRHSMTNDIMKIVNDMLMIFVCTAFNI